MCNVEITTPGEYVWVEFAGDFADGAVKDMKSLTGEGVVAYVSTVVGGITEKVTLPNRRFYCPETTMHIKLMMRSLKCGMFR